MGRLCGREPGYEEASLQGTRAELHPAGGHSSVFQASVAAALPSTALHPSPGSPAALLCPGHPPAPRLLRAPEQPLVPGPVAAGCPCGPAAPGTNSRAPASLSARSPVLGASPRAGQPLLQPGPAPPARFSFHPVAATAPCTSARPQWVRPPRRSQGPRSAQRPPRPPTQAQPGAQDLLCLPAASPGASSAPCLPHVLRGQAASSPGLRRN